MKLEIGYNHPFEIRKEIYEANCLDSFSVLFLSDLHFNSFSGPISEEISNCIAELNPTIILLGGDYVDSKKGGVVLNKWLQSISHLPNIFAIAGNHDYSFGLDKIKRCMLDNNVIWIENESHYLKFNDTLIRIDGNCIVNQNNESDFSILALHKPLAMPTFDTNYNFAFAGHLHGCQFVFWQNESSLYPGKFFYKWNILKAHSNDCQYFISKGLGDTLPLRFNCKRDMIFVQVNSIK